MPIDEGETITLRATFTDDNGERADPSTPVEVTVVRPRGDNDGPFVMNNVATGVYEYEYDVKEPYTHEYRVETADDGVEQGEFYATADATGS